MFFYPFALVGVVTNKYLHILVPLYNSGFVGDNTNKGGGITNDRL